MKLAVILIACAAFLPAQPAFDAASVKPSPSGTRVEFAPVTSGRVHVRNATIANLITVAYQVLPAQISGLPGWVDSERYDIEAKSETNASAADTRLMLQALLADRFHLQIRRESREMPAYALVVANGKTTKMTPADKSGCEPEPSPTNPCYRLRDGGEFVLVAEKVSMSMFAKALGSMSHATVVDKTGLDGVFDFKLDLRSAGFTPTPGSPSNEMDGMNAVMAGLQDQLGLKLERTKTTVEMLVIEHVEKPSAN
jgi:uncharacterized protein (TIGR03435 family)